MEGGERREKTDYVLTPQMPVTARSSMQVSHVDGRGTTTFPGRVAANRDSAWYSEMQRS